MVDVFWQFATACDVFVFYTLACIIITRPLLLAALPVLPVRLSHVVY